MTYNKIAKFVVFAAALSLIACNKAKEAPSSPKPAAPPSGASAPNAPGQGGPATGLQDPDDMILRDQLVPTNSPTTAQPTTGQQAVTPPVLADVPVATQPPIVVPPGQENAQCAQAFQDAGNDWFPGLPTAPTTTPIFTDLPDATGSSYRYTDARQDGLFAFAADRANSLPDLVNKLSHDFAKQIRDVRISADTRGGAVKVQVLYLHRMEKAAIELRGQLGAQPTNVNLTQVPVAGQAQPFGGQLTCADVDHGCKNIVLRLDMLGAKTKKVIRSVFIVHRWGEAHVTMSESERRDFARLRNNAHTLFSQYLSDTANNACLDILAENSSGQRPLPPCALQRLQQECGSELPKQPAARDFSLRSWAVVYGRAGFELDLGSLLNVQGPLAFATSRPVYPHPLLTSGGAQGIKDVMLKNNDGGGNLNLQIDFTGEPNSNSRISVSSMLPDTRYSNELLSSVNQMPQLPANQVQN